MSVPGFGVASGTLTAYAWPNGETLDELPDNAEVPMVPVRLVGASTGTFLIATTVGSEYRETDGSINLDVLATSRFGTARMAIPSSGSTLRIPTEGTSLSVDGTDLDTELDSTAFKVSPRCVTTKQASQHQTPLESYVQANGSIYAPVQVTEKTTTTQELGISVSVDGGKTFKASGEASASHKNTSEDTDITDKRATSQVWKNRVNYYRFKTTCGSRKVTYKWRPTSIYSLNVDFDVVPHPIYRNCSRKLSGGSFTKSSGKSHKYSTAVALTPVKVSASAEWGRDASLTWFPNANVQYCGNSVDGPAQSDLVEVHAS